MPTAKMSNAIYDTQAAFDPTICFTVYGSWIEAIEEVETASDRDSLAYQMFKAIANYSMYGEEPNFDNAPLRAWWCVTARGIDSSMGRRRKKFAPEEVTERERIVIDALIRHPDASIRDIWQETGVHRSSVDRIRKKYRAIIEQGQTANFHTNDSACNSDSHSCNNSNSTGETRQRDSEVFPECPNVILDFSNRKGTDNYNHAYGVRARWNYLYHQWQQAITDEKICAILDKYLSSNAESPMLKRLGDRYGRIIDGWNMDKHRPNVLYAFWPFSRTTSHNINGIPFEYFGTPVQRREYQEEQAVFESHLSIECCNMKGDLPF